MGLYKDVLQPRLCDLSMRKPRFRPYRERVIGAADGRVLEVGAGSGLNLALYGSTATEILALEPNATLIRLAKRNVRDGQRRVAFIAGSAEEIPIDDQTISTVVTTWTLCSVSDPVRALGEMRRVLKPDGQLLFVEHGLAPELKVQKWQSSISPLWERVSGGCHLNRPIDKLIKSAGFRIDRIETGYMSWPKILTFMYEGSARPY
jgi:ubiquinone/menaquinone biosynthesis C-methylase UbiE